MTQYPVSDQIYKDPSDSSTQREIEREMLNIFQTDHPEWVPMAWKTAASEFELPLVWQNAKPDATWQYNGDFIIAECYARIGELKSGHCGKLAKDVLKLVSLQRAISNPLRLRCLIIVPEELAVKFKGASWLFEVIRQAVEVVPIPLTEIQHNKLRDAVNRQAEGQARSSRANKGH